MVVLQPADDIGSKGARELMRFRRLCVGHVSGAFVRRHVARLAVAIEAADPLGVAADRMRERLDHANVVISTSRRSVSCCRERRSRVLQRRTVRQRQPRIRTESGDLAVAQAAIADREQVADLLPGRLVRDDPFVDLLPLLQGHPARP